MFRTLILTAALVVFAALFATTATAAGDAAAGKTLYDTNCMSCHGTTGKGDGPVGAVLTPRPRDFSVAEFKFDANADGTPGEDEDLVLVIQNGAGAYGGSPLMAPWPSLTEAQRADLIAFIRSLKQ